MSSFDEVKFKCPACGKRNKYQSKAGPCRMGNFTLFTAPLVVIADINEEGEQGRLRCEHCNVILSIPVQFMVSDPVVNDWSKEDK